MRSLHGLNLGHADNHFLASNTLYQIITFDPSSYVFFSLALILTKCWALLALPIKPINVGPGFCGNIVEQVYFFLVVATILLPSQNNTPCLRYHFIERTVYVEYD